MTMFKGSSQEHDPIEFSIVPKDVRNQKQLRELNERELPSRLERPSLAASNSLPVSHIKRPNDRPVDM